MKLIVISPAHFNDSTETTTIKKLIQAGIYVHIRKKACSEGEMITYLQQYTSTERQSMSIHGFHQLALQFQLNGIHLNGQESVRDLPTNWKGIVSKSCHSFDEVISVKATPINYVFLSPIYDSISKKEYLSKFTMKELSQFLQQSTIPSVIALGGVTLKRLKDLRELGFNGAALLGSFWNSPHQERDFLIKNLSSYLS